MVAAIDPSVAFEGVGGIMAIETEEEARCSRPDERGRPCYYNPSRVWALLRLYHYLHDRMPPKNQEVRVFVQHARLHGAKWERAAIRRGDIAWALRQLPPLAQEILEQVGIDNKPLRSVGGSYRVTQIYGRPISYSTVRRMRIDGVQAMAAMLGTCLECQRETWTK